MLQFFFENGITLTVTDKEEAQNTTLNEYKVACEPKDISTVLSTKISTFHLINRGEVVGIRAIGFDSGRTIPVSEILQLPPNVSDYVWKLVQRHQDASIPELLKILTDQQTQVQQVRPLSAQVLMDLIKNWKFEMVWSSNAIEGSTYTLGETFIAITRGIAASNKPIKDANWAVDGGKAVDFIKKLVCNESRSNTIISLEQLLEMHSLVLKNTLHEDILAGAFRRFDTRVTGSTFEFPPTQEVPALMATLIEWLNAEERNKEHPVAFATEVHLRFVTIHPFEDGNGRMSRLLMNLVLMMRGYAPICILPSCKPEYLASVKDYQMGGKNTKKLLAMVANETMASMQVILNESKKY
ncbi:adenosine monophosphate-protein transferase [Acrasis kona]|uniref:Adenosine monophosphate-protein transferase n=1 Tax=Acrasis kona TaxID=1008807 RepID=A0AAW2Z363_9EUKA